MRRKLCIIICLFLILETQGLPTRKRNRPTSGTNFLKNVLEHIIDRANKGIATPGDNEVLNYLSTVKLLKDRICGHHSSSEKITAPTKKQVTTSRLSTEHIASPAMPTASATTRGVTRGTSRKTTLGTTHLTKFETTRKPNLDVPERATKAPAMIVDVDDDPVDVGNNIISMNDKFQEDRNELEETSTESVSPLKTSAADTDNLSTPTSEFSENIRTRPSKPPKPSMRRPSRLHPSRRPRLSPRPSKRQTYGTLKQFSLLVTDSMNKVDFRAKKEVLRNKVSRETGNTRNDEPHHAQQLKELADDELDAILGFDEMKPVLKRGKYAANDDHPGSLSTVSNLKGEKKSAIKESLNNYENKELEQRSENKEVAKKHSALVETDSMDTVVYVRNKRHGPDEKIMKTGDEPDDILLPGNNQHSFQNDNYHSNKLPSDRNNSKRSANSFALVERVLGKGVDAILGEDEVNDDSSSGNKKLASTKTKETGVTETDSMYNAVNVGNNQNLESSGNLNQVDSTQSKQFASGFPLERTDEKELRTLLGEDELRSDSSLEHEYAESTDTESLSTRSRSESRDKTTNEKKFTISDKNKNNGNSKKDTEGLLMKLDQLTKESPLPHKETTKEGDLSVYEDLIN